MQVAKSLDEITDILKNIRYKDWTLRVLSKHNDTILCQWIFYAPDNNDPSKIEKQSCRKWFISVYSTDSEVIRTAYLAAVQAEMHETNENFTYNGVRIFDPHTDLVALSEYMRTAPIDVRATI